MKHKTIDKGEHRVDALGKVTDTAKFAKRPRVCKLCKLLVLRQRTMNKCVLNKLFNGIYNESPVL